MCLILHSRGHLTVKLMLEQLIPFLSGSDVHVLHCYDFIFRSHHAAPLDRLYILSRQGTRGIEPFKLKDEASLRAYDWPFKEASAPGATSLRSVDIDGKRFVATRLRPVLDLPSWVGQDANATAAFKAIGMTINRVTFGKNATIKPYDPAHPDETTYWMRLAFVPEAAPPPRIAFHFGPKDSPLFLTRICEILSPALVLEHLGDRLTLFEKEHHLVEGAQSARKHLMTELFYSPGTSTRIEDHRISLVTSPHFLVLNTISQGKCAFLGMESVPTHPPSIARTWFTGATHYPTTDPLSMAAAIYRYLREWAYNERDAKQKEAISSAVAPEAHLNVSHVVDALVELRFVRESDAKKGRYWISAPGDTGGKPIFSSTSANELDLGSRDKQIRDTLFGDVKRDGAISRFSFSSGGARIHYDLACQLR